MHLAIDAVGMKQAGVKTILLDVLAAAEADERVSRITVFSSPRTSRTFDFPPSRKTQEIPEALAENFLARLLWYERLLPHRVQRAAADVLLCLHNAGLSPAAIPHVTFVQRPLVYSAEARQRVPLRYRYRMPIIRAAVGRSCRSARKVFVHTPTERDSLCQALGVPRTRVDVILPQPRPLPRAQDPAPQLEPMRAAPEGMRLLFVGQLFAHKNLGVAVDAVTALRGSLPNLTLFVSGPPAQGFRHGPGIVYLGAISDEALAEAYRLATVLIMPSLHETIGLPMIEAMSLGTPVVAADRPYAHDVCEHAAHFFDPLDPTDLVARLLTLLSDEPLRTELARRGMQVIESRAESKPYARMLSATLATVTDRNGT